MYGRLRCAPCQAQPERRKEMSPLLSVVLAGEVGVQGDQANQAGAKASQQAGAAPFLGGTSAPALLHCFLQEWGCKSGEKARTP